MPVYQIQCSIRTQEPCTDDHLLMERNTLSDGKCASKPCSQWPWGQTQTVPVMPSHLSFQPRTLASLCWWELDFSAAEAGFGLWEPAHVCIHLCTGSAISKGGKLYGMVTTLLGKVTYPGPSPFLDCALSYIAPPVATVFSLALLEFTPCPTSEMSQVSFNILFLCVGIVLQFCTGVFLQHWNLQVCSGNLKTFFGIYVDFLELFFPFLL